MRRVHHAAADVQRRADDAVGADPLEREHGADDVDDRVEGADLVQVHLLDRHLMDGGLGLGQPLEQRLRAVAARRRQRRPVDQREDLRQAAMRMRDARWLVRSCWVIVRCGDRGRDVPVRWPCSCSCAASCRERIAGCRARGR